MTFYKTLTAVVMIAVSLMGTAQAAESYRGETLSNYQVQITTKILADSIDRRLGQIHTLFSSVEAFLAQTNDEHVIYSALNRMIAGLPFIRSLLVIEDSGVLLQDTSSYPAVSLDLSDRAYFQNTIQAARMELQISDVVIGRSSRFPFIPITARAETPNGNRILVAVVTPDTLIPMQYRCPSCSISLISTTGSVLASSPAGYIPPQDLLRRMQSETGQHPHNVRTGLIPSISDWERVQGGKIRILYTRVAL